MEKMVAAVFEKEGVLALREVDAPVLTREEQILIQVEAVSICGTDVHITSVPPGYAATEQTILGHELVGYIIQKGKDVTHLEVGDRVVVNPNNYCGTCVYCRKNLPNQCLHLEALGIDYHGGFAKYCVVNGKVAYKISTAVSAQAAACAEPLACAISAVDKISVKCGDTALVIGAGPIGLIIAMLLKAAGVKVFIFEISPFRIAFARGLNLGEVIHSNEQDSSKIIAEQTQIGVDYAFDVTGSQMIAAVQAVRKGGDVVLFGINKTARAQLAQCDITTKEIAVRGTWLANATFPKAVKLLEQGTVDLAALVTHTMLLEQLNEGIALLKKGEAMKIIIQM